MLVPFPFVVHDCKTCFEHISALLRNLLPPPSLWWPKTIKGYEPPHSVPRTVSQQRTLSLSCEKILEEHFVPHFVPNSLLVEPSQCQKQEYLFFFQSMGQKNGWELQLSKSGQWLLHVTKRSFFASSSRDPSSWRKSSPATTLFCCFLHLLALHL